MKASSKNSNVSKPDSIPGYNHDEIEAWVRLAQKGDTSALSRLVQATQARLYRFLLLNCGHRQLAEDLCQDAYVRVLGHLGSLEEPRGFVKWLYTAAKNLYLDWLKSPRNASWKQIETAPPTPELIQSSNSDTLLEVHQALALLEPPDRMAILLVDLEGHSYEEAAEIIGISTPALRSRLARAREAFEEKYGSH